MQMLLKRAQALPGPAQQQQPPSVVRLMSSRPVKRSSPLAVAKPSRIVLQRALATEVESSFSSLLDDEEGEEYDEAGEEGEEVEKEVDESLLVANLGLSAETMEALAQRGIFSVFQVQKQVLEPIMGGRDVVCRAKTGSGKTLAFALPVVEALIEENRALGKPRLGRPPRCVVMAPTRELANQVAREFETACPSLKVGSFYGGVAISNQMRMLERGVDVVVGTPGRIIDLLERRSLKLDEVRFAVLDEADQMLDMGFEEDMERILGQMPKENRQTLLFSATLPKWIRTVSKRYQKSPVTIDLVGEENTGKLVDTIRLLVQQVEASQKVTALQDLLRMYGNTGSGGKAIIFVNTKARADEVNMAVNEFAPCDALHGDIAQAQREKALSLFREGKYSALVATDVAARGLDIPSVDLVVHFDVPQDNEAFLHRSGRTARAGKSGTAVVLFTEREARALGLILKATKVTNAELIGAPDPAEVMRTASRSVLGKLDKVDGQVIDFFVPAAERLLSSEQPSRVLAAALAALAGFRGVPQPRSLLTYEAGKVTLRLLMPKGGERVDGARSVGAVLRRLASAAQATSLANVDAAVGRVRMIEADGLAGAAFDVPAEVARQLLESCSAVAASMGQVLDQPSSIGLDVEDMMTGGRGSYSRGGYGRDDRGGYGRDRNGGRGGGGGYGRDRDGARGGYGRDRDGGGGGGYGNKEYRERSGGYGGGGGRDFRDRDAASSSRGTGYGSRGDGGYAGRGDRDGGYAGRGSGYGNRDSSSAYEQWSSKGYGAEGYGGRAAPRSSTGSGWSQESVDVGASFGGDAGGAAYFDNAAPAAAPASSNGSSESGARGGRSSKVLVPGGARRAAAGAAPAGRAPRGRNLADDPAPADSWGTW